jgi:hypothetical protein
VTIKIRNTVSVRKEYILVFETHIMEMLRNDRLCSSNNDNKLVIMQMQIILNVFFLLPAS